MMKNILKITCAVIAFSMTTQYYSQATFGVRAGLNLATGAGKIVDLAKDAGFTTKMLPSFNVGLIAEFGVSESFSLESGLYLSGKGLNMEAINPDYSTETIEQTISALYLEVPLNASVKVDLGGAKLNIFAGPYLGIALAGKSKIQTSNDYEFFYGTPDSETDLKFGTTENDNIKRTDFGLNFGAGVQIESIVIRAQYGLGFVNLDSESDNDNEFKNRVIGISLGYMF